MNNPQKTLRDEFAMAVMAAMLGFGWAKRTPQECAKQPYLMADAMLEAREESA